MSQYEAPVEETLFLMLRVLGTERYRDIDALAGLNEESLRPVLEGAGKFAEEKLAPLNASGDAEGCTLQSDGSVSTPRGFREAFRQLSAAGWNGVAAPAEFGGQGLPYVVAAAIEEFLNGANQSLYMYTNWGFYAAALLADLDLPDLRNDYLPRLVSGEWGGAMAMTEPQAGTDLGLIQTSAVPHPDGSYRITGSKIFISGGEHDLTENIVHFVLARIKGAPAGARGISLFLVPSKLAGCGSPNGVRCTAVEHKMGVRGSATCGLHFEAAKGWLIGEEHRGLRRMFRILNHARRACGVAAVGAAEAAYQKAAAHVKERRQGRAPSGALRPDEPAAPLIAQADVRRLLLRTRSFLEAGRALFLWHALQQDIAERSPDPAARTAAEGHVALLTPIVKAVLSDFSYRSAIDAQQLFGGHGYIVATGIEQYSRDIRMLMLAEGANGVQAMDLVGRKLLADGGAIFHAFAGEVSRQIDDMAGLNAQLGMAMRRALDDLEDAAAVLMSMETVDTGAVAYDFMTGLGIVALGFMWLKIARASVGVGGVEPEGVDAGRMRRAEFFMRCYLPDAAACVARIRSADPTMMKLDIGVF